MAKKTIRFYSDQELHELEQISALPERSKERKTAFMRFCEKWRRKPVSVYQKLITLKESTKKKTTPARKENYAHVTKNEVSIPFKSVRVEGENLIFTF